MKCLFSNIKNLCASACDNGSNDDLILLKYYVQKEETANIVISSLNKLVAHGPKPSQACDVLNNLLELFPVAVISEHCLKWINLINNIKQPVNSKIVLLRKIVELSETSEEFKKVFVSSYLQNTVGLCVNSSDDQLLPAIECVSVILRKFPSACGPYKNKLESFLLKCLDIQSGSVPVAKAGVAFQFLQQAGGGGINGSLHQSNWKNEFNKLCATAESICSGFFDNYAELNDTGNDLCVPHEFPQIPSKTSRDGVRNITFNRLRNCLIFIKMMLSTGFPTTKAISIKNVLHVINGSLSLHVCLQQQVLNNAENAAILIKYQIEVLSLLYILITSLQENLLPFGLAITKLLINCVSRTQNCDCFTNNSQYRVNVYKVLTLWITVTKGSFDKIYHEKFIKSILVDVEPPSNKITLNLNTEMRTMKSAKAKNRVIQNKLTNGIGNLSQKIDVKKYHPEQEQTTRAALTCLKEFLKSVPVIINSKMTVQLYEFVIKTILSLQGGEKISRFTNSSSEISIYEILISLFEQPFLNVPLPLHSAIKLLHRTQQSRNHKLVLVAERGLGILEKLSQPVCSTMYLNQTASYVEASNKEKDQEIAFRDIDDSEANSSEVVNDSFLDSSIDEQMPKSGAKEINVLSNILLQATPDSFYQSLEEKRSDIASLNNEIVQASSDENLLETRLNLSPISIEIEDQVKVVADPSEESELNVSSLTTESELDYSRITIVPKDGPECNTDLIEGEEEVQDEPPAKKLRRDSEDSIDIKDMLDSFVDVVKE